MDRKSGKYRSWCSADSLAVFGILLGVMSWLLESFIHSQIFYEQQLDFLSSLLKPDRHELWMRCIIVSLFTAFGFYAQKVVRALLEARKAVHSLNGELARIFDTAADGMRIIGPDFTTQRVNRTFLHLAGVEEREVVGKKCHEVFRGESCQTDACPMTRILDGAGRVEYDAVKTRQDGREIPCIVTATPVHDDRGELIGIVEDFKDISERKKAELALRASHLRLRQVTSHLEMVREQERRIISRDIHDELGQNLTGLKMDVQWLLRNQNSARLEFDGKLVEMDRLLNQTIQAVRRISSEIRPELLDDLGLQAAIEAEADKVRDRLGILFDIVCLPEHAEVNSDCRNAVYRIFKEALTNIIRHAAASRVIIRLLAGPDRITLTVSDNGRGISEEEQSTSKSLGLRSMHERAWLLDGSLHITGEPGVGTTVSLTLPVVA